MGWGTSEFLGVDWGAGDDRTIIRERTPEGVVTFTNFKPAKGTAKKARAKRSRKAKAKEREHKQEARDRDQACRFPLCGCRRLGHALHVSHSEHKGIGGNPAGDRSVAEKLVYLCRMRHREGRIAIDRGTLRWRPLTGHGANGAIAWDLDGEALWPLGVAPSFLLASPAVWVPRGWIEIARETAPGELEPLKDWQRALLIKLSSMTL